MVKIIAILQYSFYITRRILIFLFLFFFVVSCHSKPSWINDAGADIGVAGFVPSQNFSKKKDIALKKAIHSLMLKKGRATGKGIIHSYKFYTKTNNKENYKKNLTQNSTINFSFENINYNVKITDIYTDEKTQEVYVRIEEVE